MKKVIRFFCHSPIKYICTMIFCIVAIVVIVISKGYTQLINYIDAFFVVGVGVILFGLLNLVSYYGAFDTMRYGFSKFFGKKDENQPRDLYEFVARKEEVRKNTKQLPFIPYIVVGSIFMVISFIIGAFL